MTQVPEELVIDLAKQVAEGTLTKEAAAIAVDLAAGVPAQQAQTSTTTGGDGPASDSSTDAGPPAEIADADEALAVLGLG